MHRILTFLEREKRDLTSSVSDKIARGIAAARRALPPFYWPRINKDMIETTVVLVSSHVNAIVHMSTGVVFQICILTEFVTK